MSRFKGFPLLSLAVLFASVLALDPAVLTAQGPRAREGAQDGRFGPLRWRSIGPLRAGRSIAVAGNAARPNEYYTGATGGGLWKTTDGGETWLPVTDGQLTSASVGAVEVSPSNPDVVYIGTGESELRGDIAQGDGIYKSTDGGKSWTHVGLADTQTISKIRVHPTNPDLVYVAALGHPAGPNAERGIFRSKDGGRTWEKILYRDDKTGGVEVVLDPNNPHVLFASLWEVFRVAHALSSGGPGSGLFKSTDGGDHWTEISRNPGLPRGILGKIGMAVSGADSSRVYAQIEAEDGGTFVSDDAGATWKKVSEDRDVRQRAFYYTRVYADPKDKDTVYAPNAELRKSIDGGRTWKLAEPHRDYHDMWIDPTNPKRFIFANDAGAHVTVNGGATYTRENYPTAALYHVITTNDVPYHVCGSQQDNSTACVSSQPPQGAGGIMGNVDLVFYSVGGGEAGYIANDPRDLDIFYAATHSGMLTRFNRKTGQMQAINPYPDNPTGYASQDLVERFQWTFPVVFSPVDPSILYTSSQHLWKTNNGGRSWTAISPDLTRHDPKTLGDSGGPITKDQTGIETYATIFTIAPSPADVNLIWTGSDDGFVQVTRDGGKTWKNVTPKDMPEFARISLVEASPFRPGTAYVAANHYQHDDFAPYAWRTDDYGETWTKIVNGVAPRDFTRAIREDTKRPKLLYLGTEHGIYVSFDDGANWQSLRQNLADMPVHDIKVEERDLVIATHGRGFYIMDNISPLRQWGAQVTELYLFKPEDMLRGLDRTLTIDYVLKKGAQKVTVDFLDGEGNVIRTLTGTASDTREPAAGNDFQRSVALRPSVAAGMHRLNWDVRYSGPTVFPGLIMNMFPNLNNSPRSRGPIAPPGRYQVRVTADGETQVQPFAIKREPHLLAEVTDADLQKEFDLAMQICRKFGQTNEAVLTVRAIRPQIEDRAHRLPKEATAAAKALDDLEKHLTAVETQMYQVKNRSSQDTLNFPIMLNNRLQALQGAVESADAAPTAQCIDVFRMLSGKVDEQISRLDQAIKTELPRVNGLLEQKKLPPIKGEPNLGPRTTVVIQPR